MWEINKPIVVSVGPLLILLVTSLFALAGAVRAGSLDNHLANPLANPLANQCSAENGAETFSTFILFQSDSTDDSGESEENGEDEEPDCD